MDFTSNDIKQLYRSVYAIVKKLDDEKTKLDDAATAISHLFSDVSLVRRKEIVEKCETLMFEDLEIIGRKARSVMWRKGYYEIISIAKRIWKSPEKENVDEQAIKQFLLEGIKNIKIIIIKFEKKFSLDLKYVIDFSIINNYIKNNIYEVFSNFEVGEFEKEIFTLNEISYALESIHSLLISLGDLHRYYIDFDQSNDMITSKLVTRYYIEAFKLNPNIGMAQNQLGTLTAGQNYELTSIYHYMFSLICQTPFELSENNLLKIFHDNSVYLNEKKDCEDVPELKDIVANLILVLDVFFFDKEIFDFDSLCRNVLLGFKCLVTMRVGVSKEMIFHIVSSFLFCLYKLNIKKSKIVHSLNAFLLAICSVLIDVCLENLDQFMDDTIEADELFREDYNQIYDEFEKNVRQARVNGKDNYKASRFNKCKPIDSNENEQSSNNSNNSNELNLLPDVKIKKKVRRRRKCRTSPSPNEDDSDMSSNEEMISENSNNYMSDVNGEENQDDNDDNSMTSFDSYDDEDDEEDIGRDSDHSYFSDEEKPNEKENEEKVDKELEKNINKLANLLIKDEIIDNSKAAKHEIKTELNRIRYKRHYNKMDPNLVITFAENEKTLMSLKILFDWLQVDTDILIHCFSSNPEFIHKIIKLVNYLNIDCFTRKVFFPRELIKLSGLRENLRGLFDDRHSIAVDEDNLLKKFRLFEATQSNIDWELTYKLGITSVENSFLEVLKIIDFGFYVCKYRKFKYIFCAKTRQFIELRKKAKRSRFTRNRNRNDRNQTRNRRRNRNYKENNYPLSDGEKKSHVKIVTKDGDNQGLTVCTKKGYLKNKNAVYADDLTCVNIIENHNDENDDDLNTKQMNKSEIMGKLWLTNEVRTLESKVKKPTNVTMTPYIVLDSKSLSEYLAIVKNLVKLKKFLILIPSAVLSELDELKKRSEGARNSIKWLEHEFSNGNRFLRTQRDNEKRKLQFLKTPKKLDYDMKIFMQIVQFCNFLVNTHSSETEPSTDVVTYLYGSNLNEKKINNFSYSGILDAIPVKSDQIVSFYSRYKRR